MWAYSIHFKLDMPLYVMYRGRIQLWYSGVSVGWACAWFPCHFCVLCLVFNCFTFYLTVYFKYSLLHEMVVLFCSQTQRKTEREKERKGEREVFSNRWYNNIRECLKCTRELANSTNSIALLKHQEWKMGQSNLIPPLVRYGSIRAILFSRWLRTIDEQRPQGRERMRRMKSTRERKVLNTKSNMSI